MTSQENTPSTFLQESSHSQQFSLIVYDSSGVPYHSVPAGTLLQGGNVVVHSK
jgi:hypothetical protein